MPTNTEMERCISNERGALVFWSPEFPQRKPGARVQIIDAFALRVVTGYTRDSQGQLLLEAQPSLASGRNWTLAKAAQLIRNDVRPHRWVALQLDRRAWGLFWAGGGLQRCRDLLVDQSTSAETASALVPAMPEALLRLVLDLNLPGSEEEATPKASRTGRPRRPASAASGVGSLSDHLSKRLETHHRNRLIWRVVLLTSLAWIAVLGGAVLSFNAAIERQDRKLERLLDLINNPKRQVPGMPSH